MNKEFKTILLLWLVSILISGLWLYQFRNVKFKNTKQLEKANQQQQEQLIKQYNELVDVYIPTITDKLPENDLVTTGIINMVMPWFLENKWFYTVSDNLEKEEIKLNIKKITSYQEFQNEIKSNLQNYDIALIPTNRLIWLNTQEINIWENIKPYFINIFDTYFNNNSNTAIPFALDPAITLYYDVSLEQNTRDKLFSYSLLWKITKKYSMPLLRWYDEIVKKLLENNSTPFEYYTEILFLQLKQIKNKWDNQELSDMLNTNNISSKNKYTYQNLKNIVDLLTKQNNYCTTFPTICTIRYWYSDIKFWYLSDLDIVEKYFPWENKLYVWNFTNSENTYPVKWRVFVVPNWNEKINLTNKFFSEYISESIEWNDSFRNNTLSAITNIYDQQKNNKFFKNIIANEKNFYIFTQNIDIQNQLINDWKTIPMLEWNYPTQSYMSNFSY